MSQTLQDWFATPLGKRLLKEEGRALQDILPHLFGYHLIQIGAPDDGSRLAASRIKHRCILGTPTLPGTPRTLVHVRAEAGALPVASDSVDVVVLPHVLEFAAEPHQILREVERVLIPEGHVVLIGFNPLSLWGIRRLFQYPRVPPWNGRFRTALRMKDWLALLGFETVELKTVFFAPPIAHRWLPRRVTSVFEAGGRRWWPLLGGVYIVTAKKKVSTLTPIKPGWMEKTHTVLAGNPVRPSIRRNKPR